MAMKKENRRPADRNGDLHKYKSKIMIALSEKKSKKVFGWNS